MKPAAASKVLSKVSAPPTRSHALRQARRRRDVVLQEGVGEIRHLGAGQSARQVYGDIDTGGNARGQRVGQIHREGGVSTLSDGVVTGKRDGQRLIICDRDIDILGGSAAMPVIDTDYIRFGDGLTKGQSVDCTIGNGEVPSD